MKTSLAVGFDKLGFMLTMLLVLMVWSGIAPADRTVWAVESVWSTGLLAILLVTRRWFMFSNAAYLCCWVWAVLQTVSAHYMFEHVPMDWCIGPVAGEGEDDVNICYNVIRLKEWT